VGRSLCVGVLALQGAFREHAKALRGLGVDVVEVRRPDELAGLDALVIPGGESTTIVRLAELYGLDDAIRAFRGPVFGTCAGMIVVDRELKRQQTSNYESKAQVETQPDAAKTDSALDRIKDLARRQEELNKRQRELAASGAPAAIRSCSLTRSTP